MDYSTTTTLLSIHVWHDICLIRTNFKEGELYLDKRRCNSHPIGWSKAKEQIKWLDAFVQFTLQKKLCIVSGVEVIHTQNDLPDELISLSLQILNLILDILLRCMLCFNTLLQLTENTGKKMPSWSCKDYKVHNSSFCPWNLLLMNYSISAESNLCVPSWNTSSWNSHTHSPEENVSKRVDLYVVTPCSQNQALSIGYNPPATHCAKGPWKYTCVKGRKSWSLMYLQVVFRLLPCPQSAVTGLVSFSLTRSLGVDCLYRFTIRINKVRQTIGDGTQQG